MDHNGVVRVELEPFDQPPMGNASDVPRIWQYYRS